MISGITVMSAATFCLSRLMRKAIGIEAPTPVPLIAFAPGSVGVGFGLGHFVQGDLADGRHEVQGAKRRGADARGRQRQFAVVEDWQIGINRARLHGFLHQRVELRGLQLGQNGPARVRRESAIRHRGPHHRRIVASLRKASAVSSGSPSR